MEADAILTVGKTLSLLQQDLCDVGTVKCAGDNSDGLRNISNWKLFNSLGTLDDERAKARTNRKAALQQELELLRLEINEAKGLFAAKRRRNIEIQLAQIEREMKERK